MKERLLRLCLLAYPPGSRGEDGELLVQDALELSERDSSLGREVRGLVAGGIAARARGVGADLRGAPWGDALRLLALPLASVNLAVWLTGIAGEWEPLPLGR